MLADESVLKVFRIDLIH